MLIKVFKKKFSSALLLGAMVFTTANGASVCALNDESAAKEVLAAANSDVGNENGENDVAEDLGNETPGDENIGNGVSKRDNKEDLVENKDNSRSGKISAGKALAGGVSIAVSAPVLLTAGYYVGNAKNKGGSNSGSSKSSNSGTTDGNTNTGAVNEERLKKLETELAETKKQLEDTKEEAASSVSWADVLFGWWGLLRNKEHIGTGRVITASIIHGVFIIWAIIELVLAIKAGFEHPEMVMPGVVLKVVCPIVGLAYDTLFGAIVIVVGNRPENA